MADYDIGTNPRNITGLITYSGSGENDGSEKKLGDFKKADRPLLLVFINTHVPAAPTGTEGRMWLKSLMGAKDSTFDMYVVMCKRDAIGWVACDEMADVIPTLDIVSTTNRDAAFSGIPVVIDGDNGAVSSLWLGGITGAPTAFNAWTYIIDRANLISDKWDTACRASHCHISFKHFKLSAVTADFDGGLYSDAAAYAKQRIQNLNAALRILYAVPAAGSLINSAASITKIALSRPIQDIPAGSFSCFPLSGGGVASASILPTSFDGAGANKVENTIALGYPAGGLTDGTSDDTVNLTLDPACIKDTDGTPIAAPDNKVGFTADATGPVPALHFHADSSSPTGGAVTLDLSFGEQVKNFDSTKITVDAGSCTVPLMNAATGHGTVQVAPPSASCTIKVKIAAGAAQDRLGNPSPALSPDFPIVYDNDTPSISDCKVTDHAVYETGGGTPIVRTDFDNLATCSVTAKDSTSGIAALAVMAGATVPGASDWHAVTGAPGVDTTSIIEVDLGSATGARTIYAWARDQVGRTASKPLSFNRMKSEPRDIVIVIDRSGSMGLVPSFDTNSGKTKLGYVCDAVNQLIEIWKAFAGDVDGCALVHYESTAQKWRPGISTLASTWADLESAVNGLQPGNMTAMGSGILNSLDLLGYATQDPAYQRDGRACKRSMILFADGQNNMPPDIAPQTESSFTIGAVTMPRANTTIPIHSFGISASNDDIGTWIPRLANLSNATGGINHAAADVQIWPSVYNSLEEFLQDIYEGSSPQIIARCAGGIADKKFRTPITVNSSAAKLVLSLSWPGGSPVAASLRRNGRPVRFTREIQQGQFAVSILEFGGAVAKPSATDAWEVLVGKRFGLASYIDTDGFMQAASGNPAAWVKQAVSWKNVMAPKRLRLFGRGRKLVTWKDAVEAKLAMAQQAYSAENAPFSLSVLTDDKAVRVKPDRLPHFCRPKATIPIRIDALEFGIPIADIHIGSSIIDPILGGINGGINVGVGIGGGGMGIHLGDGDFPVDVGGVILQGCIHGMFRRSAVSGPFPLRFQRVGRKAGAAHEAAITAPDKKGIYRLECAVRGTAKNSGSFERVFTRMVIVT